MTNTALVLSKLSTLRDHVDRMERRRPATLDEFRGDVDLQDALALSLLVALQEASDIALHIASDQGWGIASSYAASFDLLARRGVIDQDLATRLVGVAALRSRVAHGYATVDVERIWREAPQGIASLREYAAAIARFIQPAPDPEPRTRNPEPGTLNFEPRTPNREPEPGTKNREPGTAVTLGSPSTPTPSPRA